MWIRDQSWLHGQIDYTDKGQNETKPWCHRQHHPKALENPSFWVLCFVPCSSLSSCSNFHGLNVPFFRVPPGSFWKHPLPSPLYYSFHLISKQPPPRPSRLMALHCPKSFRLWNDASHLSPRFTQMSLSFLPAWTPWRAIYNPSILCSLSYLMVHPG